ncbi:general RNA polymerase II transcription factor [Chytriomyces hyalinus]|nr:general RNA polymerase II transcription factor [Chytriomyces hyalinus]
MSRRDKDSDKDKDAVHIVIETGSRSLRVGRSDYLLAPVKLQTRIARIQRDGNSVLVAGEELTKLIASRTDLDIRHPMALSRVVDWDAFEDLLKYAVVKELGIRRASNESAAIVVVPLSWSTVHVERLVQIMFETINVPGLFVLDSPLAALYAAGLVTGLVVDVGHETTDIAAVLDSAVCRQSSQTIPIGGKHILAYLKSLLKADPVFMASLGNLELDDELVASYMTSGQCKLLNAKEWTKPPLLNTIKRTEWSYKGVALSIGAQRHQAFEILFQPSLAGLDQVGLAEATYITAMGATDALEKRFSLWESILLTGGVSNVAGLQDRYESEMAIYISASATSNDFQAKDLKFVGIPEFFSAYKEGNADAAYLGGILVARLTLNSAGQHITKSDYNELGPSVVRTNKANKISVLTPPQSDDESVKRPASSKPSSAPQCACDLRQLTPEGIAYEVAVAERLIAARYGTSSETPAPRTHTDDKDDGVSAAEVRAGAVLAVLAAAAAAETKAHSAWTGVYLARPIFVASDKPKTATRTSKPKAVPVYLPRPVFVADAASSVHAAEAAAAATLLALVHALRAEAAAHTVSDAKVVVVASKSVGKKKETAVAKKTETAPVKDATQAIVAAEVYAAKLSIAAAMAASIETEMLLREAEAAVAHVPVVVEAPKTVKLRTMVIKVAAPAAPAATPKKSVKSIKSIDAMRGANWPVFYEGSWEEEIGVSN